MHIEWCKGDAPSISQSRHRGSRDHDTNSDSRTNQPSFHLSLPFRPVFRNFATHKAPQLFAEDAFLDFCDLCILHEILSKAEQYGLTSEL